ncbi:hypothetical protein SO802_011435 [Lithocarpus litseifolius]|uniref:Uncharacterized protein n=1 Tax=Lithocarpus litseifolius TaxID=425828 RepID=A0AAW2D1B7_9ROSI
MLKSISPLLSSRFISSSKNLPLWLYKGHPPVPVNHLTWEPPPSGLIKLNMDAAISVSSSALAVVARSQGHYHQSLFQAPPTLPPPSLLRPMQSFGQCKLLSMNGGVTSRLKEMQNAALMRFLPMMSL